MRFCNVWNMLAGAAIGMSVALPGAAQAQGFGDFGGGGVSGLASGLMGQALPNVSAMGAGNTTGILSYCIKNNYVQGNGASSVLSGLSAKQGVQSSSAYAAGEQGELQTGSGNALSMNGLQGSIKAKLCGMVLQHAHSML